MKGRDYVFNVGDEVITDTGYRGTIIKICNCELCKERGFLEPIWEDEDGGEENITCYEAENNFTGYHRIGDYYFNPLRKDYLEQDIAYYEDMLIRSKKRRDYVTYLLCTEGEIAYETLE